MTDRVELAGATISAILMVVVIELVCPEGGPSG